MSIKNTKKIKNTVCESLNAGYSNIENFDEEVSKAYMIS
jgi:hypothetical protein